jgi:hypothetical protein
MLPAGAITVAVAPSQEGYAALETSLFKDDVHCAKALQPKGIRYVDGRYEWWLWGYRTSLLLDEGRAPEASGLL